MNQEELLRDVLKIHINIYTSFVTLAAAISVAYVTVAQFFGEDAFRELTLAVLLFSGASILLGVLGIFFCVEHIGDESLPSWLLGASRSLIVVCGSAIAASIMTFAQGLLDEFQMSLSTDLLVAMLSLLGVTIILLVLVGILYGASALLVTVLKERLRNRR